MRFLVLILFVVFCSAAFASTMLHTVDDASYEEFGEEFSTVGRLGAGSGVYLGDGWVLTAGHIAHNVNPGNTFVLNGSSWKVAETLPYEGYVHGSLSNDIGLVRLEVPIPGNPGASVMAAGDIPSIYGETAAWVGYGSGGSGLTGATSGSAGTLRAFTNSIDVSGSTIDLPSTFMADFDSPDGSSNTLRFYGTSSADVTPMEGNVAIGDSGGGVFVGDQLVGIISFRTGNSSYGSISGATLVGNYDSWLSNVSGVTPVPEPSTVLLQMLGMLVFLTRRR